MDEAKSRARFIFGEPLDIFGDMIGTPKMRADQLPDALAGFVFDAASRMGSDPAAVALASVVALSGVMTDEWRIQPKQRDYTWTEQPRLWGAILGPPSVRKTPIIAAATRPVDKLEIAARERHTADTKKYKADLQAWKTDGSDPEKEPQLPRLDRFLIENATVEAIAEVLRDDPGAKLNAPAGKILVRQDELSEFLANLDRYKAGGSGGGDRGAYLRIWNGGRFVIDRIVRGSFAVPNFSASFIGGIQPEPIQRVARDTSDDGLLQRFLYAVPSNSEAGLDAQPDRDALLRYENLFPALTVMFPTSRLDGHGYQHVVFHAEARRHVEAVRAIVAVVAAMPDCSSRLQSALAKWDGIFPRLCLIFHLIENADLLARALPRHMLQVLQPETAKRASAYAREILLPHLIKADSIMFSTTQTSHARWIAGFILSKKLYRVQMRDIIQAYGALRAPEHADHRAKVMESLVVAAWLEPEIPDNPARAVSTWLVNPKVHQLFAEMADAERARRETTKDTIAAYVAELHKADT
jgi:hypothetical protein